MKRYYLGLDQGTTGDTAVLLDESFVQRARGYHSHHQSYPHPGWVEHDPEEILQSLLLAAEDAMDRLDIGWKDIRAVGLDNQGETCLMWDRNTGTPLCPAIVWQDRRTSAFADAVAADHGEMIRQKTGLLADAYFSATKLWWIREQVPGVREKLDRGEVLAGTLDSWLIWKLTGGRAHVTDQATASRTMLFNIHTLDWDRELLEIFGIPREILPRVIRNAEMIGVTDPKLTGGAAIPFTGAIVDQQSALYGQSCFKAGETKITYGTGCFMLMNLGGRPLLSENGLLTSIAWNVDGRPCYALDAGIYVAGAAVEWLKNNLGIIEKASETAVMAKRAGDNGGVYFVPAFSGLAAPYWDQYARGTIVGLTGGSTREHIVRATLESIAYQVSDNMKIMTRDTGIPLESIRADGGMVKNEFLMQFQADILDIPVEVPGTCEATAVGVARLAACGVGDIADPFEPIAAPDGIRIYEPRMSADRREYLLGMWARAAERARGWER